MPLEKVKVYVEDEVTKQARFEKELNVKKVQEEVKQKQQVEKVN